MKYYLGLDVHSKTTSYCLQNENGDQIGKGKIATTIESFTELREQYQIPEGTITGLESGTQAYWTVAVLADLGLEPVVINAMEVRQKARRIGQKTDDRDAFEICDGIRRGIYYSRVYIPEPGIVRLRAILSRRRHYVKLSTMEINAAKFVIRAAGHHKLAQSLTTVKAWQKLLNHPQLPKDLARDIQFHFQTWQLVHQHIAEYDKELLAAAKPFQEVIGRLMTMPGVGIITAASYFAALGRIERFPDSGRVVSYLGLAPSTYDSGGNEKHGRITKCGNTYTRSVLCEAAHHAGRPNHPLRPYFSRIVTKHGIKRAVVAVAHRMARILFQMWKNQESFNPGKLNVELIKLERSEERFVIKKTQKTCH